MPKFKHSELVNQSQVSMQRAGLVPSREILNELYDYMAKRLSERIHESLTKTGFTKDELKGYGKSIDCN